MSVFKCSHRSFRPAVAQRHGNEEVVRNGLAVTPSQALELTNQGVSISAMNSSNFQKVEGQSYKDWSVPMEYQRGVDVLADGYQAQQRVRGRLRDVITETQKQMAVDSE